MDTSSGYHNTGHRTTHCTVYRASITLQEISLVDTGHWTSHYGVVDITLLHCARVPIEVGAQPSTAVRGRAGRCLEAGEQSSVGLLGAVLWCLLTIRADTDMDIDERHMAGLCHMAGSSWQLDRPSWILGGVSWAREQGRPARVYSQLGHLGSWARGCTLYSQLGGGTGPAISWAGEQGRAGERAGEQGRAGERAGTSRAG